MKYTLIFCLMMASCSKQTWEISTSTCTPEMNDAYSGAVGIQTIMDRYTGLGLPGVAVAVYSPEGFWAGASGYSKIENKTAMLPCHLQYSQSVAKTYMAVAILKLYEEGKIKLDEKITVYLPEEVLQKVTGAEQMTVRMLLNHTSGAAEYNSDPSYVSYLLQHPLQVFTTMDYLEYIKGDPLQFTPGSKYRYTNTNYVLLALIGDQLTGDHAAYIRNEIFHPLGLTHSYYRNQEDYIEQPGLVNSYWDRYSNSVIENCSQMQQVNVASLIGDDGIIATPSDYVVFIRSLFDGMMLSESSMNEMLTFVRNDTGAYAYGYGLGIHEDFFNGFAVYGHTGGGIGAGCELGYIPEKEICFFMAVNLGTVISSPIHEQVQGIRDDIMQVLTE